MASASVAALARAGVWEVLAPQGHRGLVRFPQPAEAVRAYADGLGNEALAGFVRVLLRSVHAEAFSAWSALDLRALDETVNDREQSIRRAMLHHVTIDPQRDLLLSLTLLIIVQEAERIGDLSKSLAKAAELATAPRVGQSVHPLRRVRDRVQGLFPDVRLGFIQADARAARRVMEAHTSVKVEVADFLALIAEGEIADTNRAVVLAIAARMIGRVSSHLSNIASSVVLPFDQVRNAPTWDDTGA